MGSNPCRVYHLSPRQEQILVDANMTDERRRSSKALVSCPGAVFYFCSAGFETRFSPELETVLTLRLTGLFPGLKGIAAV